MRIKQSRLRQIIKEEIKRKLLSEAVAFDDLISVVEKKK